MIITSAEPQTICDQVAPFVGEEHTGIADGTATACPADAQQAAQMLRFASQNGLIVSPEGSGSKMDWLTPGRPSLRLLTRRMSAVREHTWQDMTCTVEPGCTWQLMQNALAEHGQRVALDPLWPKRVTVGGVVATNDSGALRLRYGGLRDLLIGMTAVLADGTIARSGGKVVKNVAGYDLPKLLCGSFGTLGLIAEMTFRLHAIARHTVTISFTAPMAEPLGKLLLRLLDSHFSTQSMQLRSTADVFALDVRLAALPQVLATQTDGLIGVAAGMGLSAESADEQVWSAREARFGTGTATFKATMLPTEIAGIMQQIAEFGGSAVAQATGILTASVLPQGTIKRLAGLRTQLEAGGGSLTLLHAPAEFELDRWGTPPGTLPLMRAIKQHFDPKAILNRGRFIGDL